MAVVVGTEWQGQHLAFVLPVVSRSNRPSIAKRPEANLPSVRRLGELASYEQNGARCSFSRHHLQFYVNGGATMSRAAAEEIKLPRG